MSALADRLNAAIARADISDSELGRRVGLHRQTIGSLRHGKHERTEKIREIADVLRVDRAWLESGLGPAPDWWQEPAPRLREATADEAIGEGQPLELVGVVTAGDGDLTSYEPLQEPVTWQIPPSWKIVQVFGKSAYPVIYEGQWAAIDTMRAQRPPFDRQTLVDLHDNIVLVQTTDGRGFLKRFCWADGAPGDFMLASIDSGRSSPFVPPEQILIIAPVVATFYVDPGQPREKRWHSKTVTVDTPRGPGQ